MIADVRRPALPASLAVRLLAAAVEARAALARLPLPPASDRGGLAQIAILRRARAERLAIEAEAWAQMAASAERGG